MITGIINPMKVATATKAMKRYNELGRLESKITSVLIDFDILTNQVRFSKLTPAQIDEILALRSFIWDTHMDILINREKADGDIDDCLIWKKEEF